MKYYIVNKAGKVEEVGFKSLQYSVYKGTLSPDTLVCTDEDNTWIPFREMNARAESKAETAGVIFLDADWRERNAREKNKTETSCAKSSEAGRERSSGAALIAIIVIVVLFILVMNFGIPSSSSGFNPAYLLAIIPLVFFCLFVWLMFSFRSLLVEIRDLLKKDK